MTTMVPMDPQKIQQMTQGYEDRINRQKASITRLQNIIADLEGSLRVAEAARDDYKKGWDRANVALRDAERRASQFAAEARNLRDVIASYQAAAEQPVDPHTADAVWERRVPEPVNEGPSESTSDEVLEFDAFRTPVMPAGEVAPGRLL